MKNWIAAVAILAAAMLFPGCGSLLPLERGNLVSTYVGVLEDKREDLVVVRDHMGDSQIFWLSENVTCDPEPGEQVVVSYTGDRSVENQVLEVIRVSPV